MFIDDLINDWPLDASSIELLVSASRTLKDSDAGRLPWSKSRLVNSTFELCALRHFRFEVPEIAIQEVINKAIASGTDFYYGNWSDKTQIQSWCENLGLRESETNRELSRAEMLTDPSKLEPWRETLSQLMFFCLATNSDEALSHICDWFESDMPPEYTGLTYEVELTTVVLASFFRNKPMAGIEKLIAKISKSKRNHATTRLQLFQAAFDGDQEIFSKLLPEAIEIYYKKREPWVASDLIAVDESTACLLAQRRGLKLPNLTDKQHWAILSPESLLLETPNES